MKRAAWIVIVYGMIVIMGGIMGQVMAKSTTSLIMGLFSGLLLLLTGMGMYKNNLLSAYIAILFTLALDAFFTYRFLLTFSLFPAGIMCILSFVVLLTVLHILKKQSKKQHIL